MCRKELTINTLRRLRPKARTGCIPDYGYRWYDALTGRWPSRDPIWEMGGVNLYVFALNATPVWIDDSGNKPLPVNWGNLSTADLEDYMTEEERKELEGNRDYETPYRTQLIRIFNQRKPEITKEESGKGCSCGTLELRLVTKDGWGGGVTGDWFKLDSDPAKLNQVTFDPEQRINWRVVGGTCESYLVRVEHRRQSEDIVNGPGGAESPTFGLLVWGSKPTIGSAGTEVDLHSDFRVNYHDAAFTPRLYTNPNGSKKVALIYIVVTGYKREERCCTTLYRIKVPELPK